MGAQRHAPGKIHPVRKGSELLQELGRGQRCPVVINREPEGLAGRSKLQEVQSRTADELSCQ